MTIGLFERPRASRGTVIASAVFLALFTYALIDYVSLNKACGRCEMSFMNPVFEKVALATNGTYSLYRYLDASLAAGHQQPTPPGHLFLYIPGSAASYKQIRSLGSEILKRCPQGSCSVYSVDFDEEQSAFDTGAVYRQIGYVGQAIDYLRLSCNPARIVLIGHSMGGVVARQAGCTAGCAAGCTAGRTAGQVDEVVELAAPSSPPIPSMEMEAMFGRLPECKKGLRILSALHDIQIVNKKQQPGIRVDAVPLSWSDPHHQAIVWSNSLMRAVADYLVLGKRLDVVALQPQVSMPDRPIQDLQSASESCGDFGPFSGSIITEHRMGSDFDVLTGNAKVEVSVVPGRYSDASVDSGRIRTLQHSYLSVVSGADYYLRKHCSKPDRPSSSREHRFGEYFTTESPFEHLFDRPVQPKPPSFRPIAQQTLKQCLLPFAVYAVGDCQVSVRFPDGTTVHPDGLFLTGPFGTYSITIFGDCKQGRVRLAVSKTLLGWANRDKRSFLQTGLVLGLTRRMPLVYVLLAILVFTAHPASLLLGFLLGSSLFVLFLDPEPVDPCYRPSSDDLFLLTPLCVLSSGLSVVLPYPIGCITCIPGLVYAFVGSKKKRLKAAQIAFILAFELASGLGAAWDAAHSKRLPAGQSVLFKLLPVAFNYSLAMHVEVLVMLPLATLFGAHLPVAAAVVCVVGARLASDHERKLVK